jgi:multicomponent K+:H+ antiporter subunit G
MMLAPNLPLWAAILVSVFIVAGAALTLIGAVGLVRLRTFYERVHAPTLGATMGTALILLGSVVCFTVLQSRPVLHEVLIAVFATLTTPVTLILLVRAALYRDRTDRKEGVPPPD